MREEERRQWNRLLNKCPFCGGRAELEVQRGFIDGHSKKVAVVICSNCHARSNKYDATQDKRTAKENAINAWNRRPQFKNDLYKNIHLPYENDSTGE